MTSTTDIGNRALQLLGTRTTMTSLAEQSNEAKQITIAFLPIQTWCFGLTNWNFARSTAALTLLKGPPPLNPSAWTSTYPPPPWLYEYALPADFIRAWYLTNSAVAPVAGYLGEPKRFVLAVDTASASQEVLLTNETSAILVYTASLTDPTLWPWYFERLAVIAIAQTVCMALTGNKSLYTELAGMLEQQINISIQSNAAEGLSIEDNTPEWIQATGIIYPYRRVQGIAFSPGRQPPRQSPNREEQ